MVILCTNQDGNGRLVEAPALAVPLLDAIQCALARQVEHEQDSDGIVTDEGEHVDEFALATEIPDGKGDFSVADGDGLFHKVDAKGLDVVFVPTTLDVLDH